MRLQMTGHGQKLTQKQDKLFAALITEETIMMAAEKAGVAEVTVYRWLKLDEFETAYRQVKAETVRQAIAQVQKNSGVAVRVLREVAEDTAAPASSRVSVARAIIETAVKGVDIDDLATRVETLEALIESSDQKPTGTGRRW
jgi:hypothetical protein